MNPNIRNSKPLTFDNWGFIHHCIHRLAGFSNLALKEDWFYGARYHKTIFTSPTNDWWKEK